MSKDKDKGKEKGRVIKAGNKYLCEECRVEVPEDQPCPECKKEFEWDKIRLSIHY